MPKSEIPVGAASTLAKSGVRFAGVALANSCQTTALGNYQNKTDRRIAMITACSLLEDGTISVSPRANRIKYRNLNVTEQYAMYFNRGLSTQSEKTGEKHVETG